MSSYMFYRNWLYKPWHSEDFSHRYLAFLSRVTLLEIGDDDLCVWIGKRSSLENFRSLSLTTISNPMYIFQYSVKVLTYIKHLID